MASFIHRAKITVYNEPLRVEVSKYVVGTEEEIYSEAMDWTEQILAELVSDCENESDEQFVIDFTNHVIEWEDDDYLKMFAVLEPDVMDPVYGIYPTYEEAEEAIISASKVWAAEVMESEDSMDVIGHYEWDPEFDFDWLVNNCKGSFRIQEIPVFGVRYKNEF